ncbi:type VII secretion target [Gordonia westfalica]|uniref:Type VII secretion target n=1 Tax=Gordonia westfalica TaxID=158898 RepID=A0ABU2GQA8_9ACTN|nr:type VII secretion target [Gordonia westfalica]MDS1113645.1 type VII secretion target [Gordonia westfalica]
MEVDPARVRELGGKMRATAGTVRALAPLDGGVNAEIGAGGNELVANLRNAAMALNKVVTHHANTYVSYADLCMRAAESYENADHEGAAGIGGVGPGPGTTVVVPAKPGG